ncbi:MAG: carbon starvation CstA family protein [Pseudomonadota bacterium]
MNSLFLLLAAMVVAVLGYRFFAKLVTLGVFRLSGEYSPGAASPAPVPGELPCPADRLLPYHGVALSGGLGLIGAVFASAWGWVPAFLWVLIGSSVAAGVFGIGSLWLARRAPGQTLSMFFEQHLGAGARGLLVMLSALLLIGLAALCASLIAALFAAYPAVVLPFLLHVLIAWMLGRTLRKDATTPPWLAIGVATTLLLAGTAILTAFPSLSIALGGSINLDIGGQTQLSLDAVSGWVILLFLYGAFTLRTPLVQLARPRAILSAMLAVLLVAGLLLFLIILRPPLVAPEFHTAATRIAILPWLFVTVSFGALAGVHLLIARGLTSRQMVDDTSIRRVGYGGAAFDGLLAISAVLIAATAAGDEEAWSKSFGAWLQPADLNPLYALLTYIEGYAVHAAEAVGGADWIRLLAVLTICALLATGLETALRLFKQLLDESAPRLPPRLAGNGPRLWLAIGLPLAVALLAAGTKPHGGLWFVLGGANLVLAMAGFLIMALALRTPERPRPWLLAAPLLLFGLTLWVLVPMLLEGWRESDYLLLAGTGMLILVTGGLLRAAIARWRSPVSA